MTTPSGSPSFLQFDCNEVTPTALTTLTAQNVYAATAWQRELLLRALQIAQRAELANPSDKEFLQELLILEEQFVWSESKTRQLHYVVSTERWRRHRPVR